MDRSNTSLNPPLPFQPKTHPVQQIKQCLPVNMVMREMQENYYLILFIFASQLYFYVLGPSSLLGY